MGRPRIAPQIPGSTPPAPSTNATGPAPDGLGESLPTVPQPLLDEIAASSNEALIAMDTAERDGENRPEVVAAIDAELRGRIAKLQPVADQPDPQPEPEAPARPLRFEAPAITLRAVDVDPATIAAPVLTTDGWVVPHRVPKSLTTG